MLSKLSELKIYHDSHEDNVSSKDFENNQDFLPHLSKNVQNIQHDLSKIEKNIKILKSLHSQEIITTISLEKKSKFSITFVI